MNSRFTAFGCGERAEWMYYGAQGKRGIGNFIIIEKCLESDFLVPGVSLIWGLFIYDHA